MQPSWLECVKYMRRQQARSGSLPGAARAARGAVVHRQADAPGPRHLARAHGLRDERPRRGRAAGVHVGSDQRAQLTAHHGRRAAALRPRGPNDVADGSRRVPPRATRGVPSAALAGGDVGAPARGRASPLRAFIFITCPINR